MNKVFVKQEPVYNIKQEPIEPEEDDNYYQPHQQHQHDDFDNTSMYGGSGTGDPVDDWGAPINNDPDADVDDKRRRLSHTSMGSPPPPIYRRSHTSVGPILSQDESMIRNVSLTPIGRNPSVVDSRRALPHENTVFGLDAYDEPPQVSMSNGRSGNDRAISDSTQSAAAFVNYVVARTTAGGPPIRQNDGGGYGNVLIRNMLNAPPHRTMPASQSRVAQLRLDATPLDWEQFVELCATARPGEAVCCAATKCEALKIQNKQGQRINNTPWVAHWFAHERAKIDGPERDAFQREWSQRYCIACEIMIAARMFYWSSCTVTAVNASHNVKAAVGWFVLVNRDGEFQLSQTIGPNDKVFNGLIGNIPRPALNGWRISPSTQTSRVEFVPPYKQCPPAADSAAHDGQRGF